MTIRSKMVLTGLVLAVVAGPALAHEPARPGQMTPGAMMGRGQMMTPDMMRGDSMMHGDGTMMQMPMMRGMGPGSMMGMGSMMRGPGQYIDGRLAFLKTELHITAAQEAAWKPYADALRASSVSMQAMHDRMMSSGMPDTLPERLQWHEQMMTSQLEALKKLEAAALDLYNALSPDQKKRADDLLIGMM